MSAAASVTPHNLEAEKAILGAILVCNSVGDVAAEHVAPGDFFRVPHQQIFTRMLSLADRGVPIDLITLKDDLARTGELEDVGGPAYITSLADGVPKTINVEYYARIVKEKALGKRAATCLEQASAAVKADPSCLANGFGARLAAEVQSIVDEAHSRARTPSSMRAQTADDVIAGPSPVEIVEGIAWAGCVTVLVGESGTGKTFLLNDLEAAVANGVRWHGRETLGGSVVHVTFEGDALKWRLRALRDARGPLNHFHVIRASAPLSPRVSRDGEEPSAGEQWLLQALVNLKASLAAQRQPPIVLVVIDTVRASLSGSEDSSEHVSAYLRACRRILAAVLDAALVLSHHSGWQDGDTQRKRERGSSAWRGNCDATLYLEAAGYDHDRGEAALTLRTLKVRDGEKPPPLQLIRQRVILDERDRNGRPVTSCIIVPDSRSELDRVTEAQTAADQAERASDVRTLRAIAEHPAIATSQDRLRVLLNVRKAVVAESLSRLTRQGLILQGKRGEPYTITEAGRCALAS